MVRKCVSLLVGMVLLAVAGAAQATSYTSDSNIADFTAGIASYATFSNYQGGDVGSPFTPTSDELATQGFRVYGGGSISGLPEDNNWILASFASPVSQILVFPSLDHVGADYDGYQYTIAGSNDGTTWTPLFDVLSVNGDGEPFTLGTISGTAPTSVNNVLTPGAGPGGTVGYEAEFSFGQSYAFYAFGASTYATSVGNGDQELSAVGTLVPEPSTSVLLATGLVGLLGFGWRRRSATRDFAAALAVPLRHCFADVDIAAPARGTLAETTIYPRAP